MKNFKTFLESPQIIMDLNHKYIDNRLIKMIQPLIDTGEYERHNNILVFRIGLTRTLYALIDTGVIGAVEVNIVGIKNEVYDEITLSKRYKIGHGLLSTLIPFIHKDQGRDIISGSEHTPDSVAVWYKILKTPSRVNAKESSVIPEGPKEKNKIWGRSEKFKNKRIRLKF